MKTTRIIAGTFVIVLFIGISWITADIYTTKLHLSSNAIYIIRTSIVIFWILVVFSWFSGSMTLGAHIRFMYRILMIILGIMFYLFLGSVLLGVLVVFVPNITEAIAMTVVVLAIVLAIIGFIQARIIKIKNYQVVLLNAPASWDNKTAVFLSDTHFGLMNHEKFSDKIINKILIINPDLVLHGGDFYDGPKIKLAPITASWKRLTAKIPVFYTSGNHEHYGDYESFISSIKEAGITVLLDQKIMYDGVQIVGITYRGKNKNIEVKKVLEAMSLDPNTPTILINHPPTFHNSAKSVSTNLMLSGHTHRGQFWPIQLITRIIYGKFHYGSHNVDNMIAITSSGVGTASPPMRLFNTPELVVIKFKIE